jgi:hypothetical protein
MLSGLAEYSHCKSPAGLGRRKQVTGCFKQTGVLYVGGSLVAIAADQAGKAGDAR